MNEAVEGAFGTVFLWETDFKRIMWIGHLIIDEGGKSRVVLY